MLLIISDYSFLLQRNQHLLITFLFLSGRRDEDIYKLNPRAELGLEVWGAMVEL